MTYTPSDTPKPQPEKYLIFNLSSLNPEGEPVWHFLAVPQSRMEAFRQARQSEGNLDLSQFGKILASGKGEQPPEEVRQEVMRSYAAAEN